jgi:hypothetical protein
MHAALRNLIWHRAEGRCEYCRLPQDAAPVARFQIEHIRAKQHGGSSVADNLALACPRCNAFKGPNLTAVDPETDQVVAVFHPRLQAWCDHFAFDGAEILGLTPTGRATTQLLRMNDDDRIHVRAALLERGEFYVD